MANPKYTYGVEAGQDVSPLDSEKHILVQIAANTAGSVGGPSGQGPVVGIQETRTVTKNAATDANYTIPAGWLSYTIEFSSDFTGTVNGIARTGAATPSISDCASPGNTVQAIAVTRSAGTYTITEGRRP